MKARHFFDIFEAIYIAHCDTSVPATKRSYRAAEKALMKEERLILAAPELLRVAKAYIAFCDDGEGKIAPLYKTFLKAIAKAEG